MSEIKRQIIGMDLCESCDTEEVCALTESTDSNGKVVHKVICRKCEDRSKVNYLTN